MAPFFLFALGFPSSSWSAAAPIPGALPPESGSVQGAPVVPPGESAKDLMAKLPSNPAEIGITEKLGGTVSVNELKFRDDTGKEVRLADYLSRGKPVLLSLIYYECPGLCNFVLNGMVRGLKGLNWTPGKEFELVAVSIDPKETPELAAKKKASYLNSYGRAGSGDGLAFPHGPGSFPLKSSRPRSDSVTAMTKKKNSMLIAPLFSC